MYLWERAPRVPAAGAAGNGMAQSAASNIAVLVFPNCFTVPTLLTEPDRNRSINSGLPHAT
jgi:hypothetical protein